MTGTALNRRLAADLDKAFPAFVTEMQSAVFNGARRWLPGRQDAEDVTQEVFVRAYKALQSYPAAQISEMRLRPWLFTITLNLCRNHARSRSRRPVQVALKHSQHPDRETTDATAVSSVMVEEWRQRLAQLPARQRDAIVLRHVVDLSYAEIAEVLDRPAGTVKSDVSRGLDRLRKMITKEHAVEELR